MKIVIRNFRILGHPIQMRYAWTDICTTWTRMMKTKDTLLAVETHARFAMPRSGWNVLLAHSLKQKRTRLHGEVKLQINGK